VHSDYLHTFNRLTNQSSSKPSIPQIGNDFKTVVDSRLEAHIKTQSRSDLQSKISTIDVLDQLDPEKQLYDIISQHVHQFIENLRVRIATSTAEPDKLLQNLFVQYRLVKLA
jgi:hypothetical protein